MRSLFFGVHKPQKPSKASWASSLLVRLRNRRVFETGVTSANNDGFKIALHAVVEAAAEILQINLRRRVAIVDARQKPPLSARGRGGNQPCVIWPAHPPRSGRSTSTKLPPAATFRRVWWKRISWSVGFRGRAGFWRPGFGAVFKKYGDQRHRQRLHRCYTACPRLPSFPGDSQVNRRDGKTPDRGLFSPSAEIIQSHISLEVRHEQSCIRISYTNRFYLPQPKNVSFAN